MIRAAALVLLSSVLTSCATSPSVFRESVAELPTVAEEESAALDPATQSQYRVVASGTVGGTAFTLALGHRDCLVQFTGAGQGPTSMGVALADPTGSVPGVVPVSVAERLGAANSASTRVGDVQVQLACGPGGAVVVIADPSDEASPPRTTSSTAFTVVRGAGRAVVVAATAG